MGPTRSWRSRTRNLRTVAAGRGGLCQRINRAFRLCIRGEEVCEKGGGGGGKNSSFNEQVRDSLVSNAGYVTSLSWMWKC